MDQEKDDVLYPIAVLMDELKHEDVVLRLNAIKRLGTIALALGPLRTRTELIRFLDGYFFNNIESVDDDDEILLALAQELGEFVDYVGGPTFSYLLLQPLETLAAVEETVVREKAIESCTKIVTTMPQQHIEEFYLPMLKRLSTGDWFTSRTSACGLYAACYPLATPKNQEELKKSFGLLCNDDTPMVRRSAATHLAALIKVVEVTSLLSDIFPYFHSLAQDDQDSVRLLTVEDFIAFARILKPEGVKQYLFPTLKLLCQDSSWRVRYMIADKFVAISNVSGLEIVKDYLLGIFVTLLKDQESEVRTAACNQLPEFSALIPSETVLADILPCVKELTTDNSQHVRGALASHINGLAPILGKQSTIDYLLPLFLQLLKDEASEVRLNVISKLDGVNQVIGIQLLSQSLLPAIVELAEDKQWRVRMAIIENIPILAQQLGVSFFDEKLGNLCLLWLGDSVFSIREAASLNIKKLVQVFGPEWAIKTIFPKLKDMAKHTNHVYRLTTVLSLKAISQTVTPQVIQQQIVPVALLLGQDPIPNIRFNVCQLLEQIGTVGGTESKGLLTKLKDDVDLDVKYFAQKALRVF